MATKKKSDEAAAPAPAEFLEPTLANLLSNRVKFKTFDFWLVGKTPLITHAWSHKAKLAMLKKQSRAVTSKEARDPKKDFTDSMYAISRDKDGNATAYGFPVTALKKAMIAVAHKDKGTAKTDIKASLWLKHDMISVRPALVGAVCDMPMIRLWASKPEMREDMVRVGVGVSKTASLAYRGQFRRWALRLAGKYDPTVLNPAQIGSLVFFAGVSCGIGEWRNEKDGVFGSFRMVTDPQEIADWNRFADGKGPLPQEYPDLDDLPELIAAE
jgi:hypothetical protein